MKPRNFPSRRAERQRRAMYRALGVPAPRAAPEVADIRFRLGWRRRADQLLSMVLP